MSEDIVPFIEVILLFFFSSRAALLAYCVDLHVWYCPRNSGFILSLEQKFRPLVNGEWNIHKASFVTSEARVNKHPMVECLTNT
jgi:hypothetical protein